MKKLLLFAFILILPSFISYSQENLNYYCRPCELPCLKDQASFVPERDTVMDVYMNDGTVIPGVTAAIREVIEQYGIYEQAIRVYYIDNNGRCRDTLLVLNAIKSFEIMSVGGLGAPLVIKVKPVREFFAINQPTSTPNSFLELTANLGYGGADDSKRDVGFDNLNYGAELLIAPLGSLLGNDLALGFSAGIMSEGGRLRYPIQAHLRWTFLGKQAIVDSLYFVPSKCRFQCRDGDTIATPGPGYTQRESSMEVDSSAYLVREKFIKTNPFRPFLYIEGGPIFNGNFAGAGGRPSINPDEYAQYMAGIGLGTPIGRYFTVSLGYRFMRLNLRTPCVACQDRFVVNTNQVHSILLKAGFRVDW